MPARTGSLLGATSFAPAREIDSTATLPAATSPSLRSGSAVERVRGATMLAPGTPATSFAAADAFSALNACPTRPDRTTTTRTPASPNLRRLPRMTAPFHLPDGGSASRLVRGGYATAAGVCESRVSAMLPTVKLRAEARGTPALTVEAASTSRPILERLGFTTVGWLDALLDQFE